MNKRIIVSMGLPIVIKNTEGKEATIELNRDHSVTCRYHPNNTVYLRDADLKNWTPSNSFKRLLYNAKVKLSEAQHKGVSELAQVSQLDDEVILNPAKVHRR